jgi:hypothetical protein
MTDILVQNAIADVSNQIRASSQKVNYVDAFGTSLKDKVKALIISSASNGPYTQFLAAPAAYLCDLSDVQKISKCTCNYSGSGTSSTSCSNTQNPWTNGTVLKGAATAPDQTAVSTRIRLLDTVLNNIWNEAQTQTTLDIYLAYVALKDTFTAENTTTVLGNWYGVGISPNVQGARLSNTNFIKVCGASGAWACGLGASCTWTVPAGATQVKFQVWGAGMGSNPACCCGGAPFSSTGGYAEMVISATPGEQYSICAGCSCQRSCCSNETPGCGCASGVTGPGICCLQGSGVGCYTANCNNMNFMRCQIGVGSACYRFQNPYCTDSGPCWCSQNEYCFSNSCATCGVVPAYPACCEPTSQSCATLTRAIKDGPQHVMFGIIGGGCLDTNNYGYHVRPPIINSDTGLQFTDGCTIQTFSSGSTCGGCNGWQWGASAWHPGHGGAGTHVMGGDNTHKGDYGRAGMVQVSWI